MIVASNLKVDEKKKLLKVLNKHKRAIAQKISDIKGMSSSFCTHKILMEEHFKLVVQLERRLILNMKEVMKVEEIKLLNTPYI